MHRKQLHRQSKPQFVNEEIQAGTCEIGFSNISSRENNDHEQELSQILKTNKILIENKRHIYETKINSYEQKMQKLQQLIKTSTDAEQKHDLYQKYIQVEQKKKQSQLKLQKVAKIQIEMLLVQQKQNKQKQDWEEEGVQSEQWRIRTHSTYNRRSGEKKYLDRRIHRSTSIQQQAKQTKAFNKTCKPFVGVGDRNFMDCVNPLEDSNFDLYSNCEEQGEEKMTITYATKPLSIYNTLLAHEKEESEWGRLQESKKVSQKGIKIQRSKSKPNQNNDRDKIRNLEEEVRNLKNQLTGKREQQIQLKEIKIQIVQQLALISTQLNRSNFSKNSLIGSKTNIFLEKLKQELAVINRTLEDTKIDEKTRQNSQRQIKILTQNNKKLSRDSAELIDKQRELLESIDELQNIKQNTMCGIIEHLEHTCAQLGASQVRQITSIQDRSNKIVGLFDAINKCIQGQKVTALEKKEMILSLDYKLSILKDEQEKLRNKIEELKEQISQENGKKRQLEKQNSRLNKDNQSLNLETNRLHEEVAEFQDLSGIRKNYYQELQNKYNKLKSKKTKIEQNIQTLEKQQRDLEESTRRIGELIDRNEKYLNKINDQIKCRRVEREEIMKSYQDLDRELGDKTDELNQVEKTLVLRKENVKKLQKKGAQIEENLNKLSQQVSQAEQHRFEIQRQIEEREKYMKITLPASIRNLEETKNTLELQVKQIQQNQQTGEEILSKLNTAIEQKNETIKKIEQFLKELIIKKQELVGQNEQLVAAKDELEDTIGEILNKKEELFCLTHDKYEELEHAQHQYSELIDQMQQKAQELSKTSSEIEQSKKQITEREHQKKAIQQHIFNAEERLQAIIEEIDYHQDQELNLHQRITELKKLQNNLVVEIAIRLHTARSDDSQSDNSERIQKLLREAMTSPQVKYQIQEFLGKIQGAKEIKEKYGREKQVNRKLKLQNEQYRKMLEIEEQTLGNIEICS